MHRSRKFNTADLVPFKYEQKLLRTKSKKMIKLH